VARTPTTVPYAVGLTTSTSFANPAVTIVCSLSDTFAGVAPHGIPGFIAAQLAGACLAVLLARWLWQSPAKPH